MAFGRTGRIEALGFAAILMIIGVTVRWLIIMIDKRLEPEIMRRKINRGSEEFFAREAVEGDPMVNQLTGTRGLYNRMFIEPGDAQSRASESTPIRGDD